MKKIINWTFGACFRTIGRFLAIFIVGVLLIFIGSKLGFKLDSILPIKVNATVTTNWASSLPELDRAQLYDCSTNNSCTNVLFQTQGLTVEPNKVRNILTSNGPVTIGKGGIAVQYYSGNLKAGYLYQSSIYMCSNKDLGTASIYSANYDTPGINDSTSWATTTQGLSGVPGNGDHEFNTCRVYSGLFVPNSNGGWIVSRFTSNTNITNAYPTLIGYETEELGIYTDTIKNIIQNSGLATAQTVEEVKKATEQVKEEAKKTNDTIVNSDVSGANDSASGFFDSFEDNDFGLSSIITAPLRAINAMLNDTCIAPGATYKGQSFSFPCGNMLWSREGGQDFRNFLNIFYGGFLVYFVIRSLFLDIEKLKNPNNDKVEVEKL